MEADKAALDAQETMARQTRSFQRALTFFGTTLSMLVSGTGYLAGLWTVQYASRVGYSQTQMATVGSVGFILSALTAIPLGKLGDTLDSPAPLLLFGGALMFLGYFCLGGTYLGIVPHIHVAMSALYVAMAGNVASLQGALHTNVRNYSEKLRGLATGIPISALGLSAFFFTGIARAFFMVPNEKGGMTLEVGKFLVGVGVIGGVVLALGAAIVRKVPLEPEDGPPRRVPTFNSESNGVAPRQQQQRATIPSTATVTTEGSPLLESAVLPSDVTTTDDDEIEEEPEPPQLRIVKTCLHTDTLLWLYAKLALSGAGAMFIGNVGSVVLAMAGDALPDDPDLQKRQSAVVATISIGSCLGRILFGFLYDVARRSFGARRVTLFLFLAMAMCGCQLWLVAMLRTGSADILPLLGTVMGTFYGGIAMSAPVVNAELFGAQFSAENYGAVMLGDATASYAYNILFGLVWDAHRLKDPTTFAGMPLIVCHGEGCLLGTFVITSATTALAAVAMATLRWRMDRAGLAVRG